MKNRIYFFTGTGNSLSVAKDIAKRLPDCELVAICKGTATDIPQGYDRIGFVFPIHYWGLPNLVSEFLQNATFPKQENTYFFSIATYGAIWGDTLPQANQMLKEKNIHMQYGGKIKMFSNYVTLMDMKKDVDGITKESVKRAASVIQAVVDKVSNSTSSETALYKWIHKISIRQAVSKDKDKNYNVTNDCISCGICKSVCPVKNIEMINGKPTFAHRCECCMACIQYCPKRAINYKNKTQSRGRYTHPQVSHAEISKYYNN